MLEINTNNFEEEVLKSDKPVLLRFYLENGCMPCNNYKPVFDKFSVDHPEIKCVSISKASNKEKSGPLAEQFEIRQYPTTIAFYKGEVISREVGVVKPERLLKMTKTIENSTTEELEEDYYDINIEIAKAEKFLFALKRKQMAIFAEVGRRKLGGYSNCFQECSQQCPDGDSGCIEKCQDICKHGKSCMSNDDRAELKAYLNK